jgi:hypothetical protein
MYDPNQEIYYDAPVGGHEPEIVQGSVLLNALPPIIVNRFNGRLQRQLEEKARFAAIVENYRARFANEGIAYVGALCATAEAIIQAYPNAHEAISIIVRGFAESFNNRIERW